MRSEWWVGAWALGGLAVALCWIVATLAFSVTWGQWTVYSWPGSLHTMTHSGELLTARTLPADLLAIDQGQRQPVGDHGPQLLDQIECQRRPAGAVRVQESHLGIQPHRFAGRYHVVRQQNVEERQQRVHVVAGRAAGPFVQKEVILLLEDQFVEGHEVDAGGVAFEASQPIDRPTNAIDENAARCAVGKLRNRRILQNTVDGGQFLQDLSVGHGHDRSSALAKFSGLTLPAVAVVKLVGASNTTAGKPTR